MGFATMCCETCGSLRFNSLMVKCNQLDCDVSSNLT